MAPTRISRKSPQRRGRPSGSSLSSVDDLKPEHKRGPWNSMEDEELKMLMTRHEAGAWVKISNDMVFRSPKQCRERWHQNLNPDLNHGPITPEEGVFITEMVAKIGKKWAEIARGLKNRSDNAVKNWWNGGQNRRKRQEESRAAAAAQAEAATRVVLAPVNDPSTRIQRRAVPSPHHHQLPAPYTVQALSQAYDQQHHSHHVPLPPSPHHSQSNGYFPAPPQQQQHHHHHHHHHQISHRTPQQPTIQVPVHSHHHHQSQHQQGVSPWSPAAPPSLISDRESDYQETPAHSPSQQVAHHTAAATAPTQPQPSSSRQQRHQLPELATPAANTLPPILSSPTRGPGRELEDSSTLVRLLPSGGESPKSPSSSSNSGSLAALHDLATIAASQHHHHHQHYQQRQNGRPAELVLPPLQLATPIQSVSSPRGAQSAAAVTLPPLRTGGYIEHSQQAHLPRVSITGLIN